MPERATTSASGHRVRAGRPSSVEKVLFFHGLSRGKVISAATWRKISSLNERSMSCSAVTSDTALRGLSSSCRGHQPSVTHIPRSHSPYLSGGSRAQSACSTHGSAGSVQLCITWSAVVVTTVGTKSAFAGTYCPLCLARPRQYCRPSRALREWSSSRVKLKCPCPSSVAWYEWSAGPPDHITSMVHETSFKPRVEHLHQPTSSRVEEEQLEFGGARLPTQPFASRLNAN